MEPKVRLVNRAKTTKLATEINDRYYADLRQAEYDDRTIGWTCGPCAFELLRTMDIAFLNGETYGAYSAANKGNVDLKRAAEAESFSIDGCSYWRAVGGLALLEQKKMPVRPDMYIPLPHFVLATNMCQTQGLWGDSLGRQLGVPSFVVDVPITWQEEQFGRNVEYVKSQLVELIAFLEQITGRKFDHDRLREIVGLVKEGARLRMECMNTLRSRPAPMTFFDALISLGPIHVSRGTPESIDYFQKWKAEIDERLAQGVGAIASEKYRLYWDNLPVWFKLGTLSERFATFGGNVICGFYTNDAFYSNWEHIDAERPLDAIAWEVVNNTRMEDIDHRLKRIVRWAEEFSLDGIVVHSARTCRPYDIGQLDLMARLEKEHGLPGVLIDGDPTDPDYYSDAQTDARLEAFADRLSLKPR